MRSALVLLLVVASSCVDTGPGPQPRVDAKYARAHLLEAAPADLDKFDVALGDKAIYLGNTLDRQRLVPGQSLTIKHYWKVLKPIGKGFRPFALVRGPQGTADFMNLDATDMQIAYPVAQWKAGDIIEDVQTITMRPDWSSPYAFLYVGLIEIGRHGTLDRMAVTPASGPRTQDRAIIAAKLEIDLSRAPPPPGTIHIPRANGPIAVDGQQIDQGWANALTSPEFVTGEGFREEPNGKATAKVTWDDFYLYLFVSIVDSDVSSPYKNHDDPLWKADCVEIFIDADGNRAGYIELQVNPHNATFDSWFAGPRGSAGDVAWDSGMVTAVKVRGTPDGGDTDQGWDAEIAIPWTAIRGRDANMAVTLPPRIGDRWKLNVVRVDKRGDSVIAQSWNRITYADFHALDRMLTAVFADPTGSTVPSENATGSEASSQGLAPAPGTGSGSTGAAGSGSAGAVGSGSAGAAGSGSASAAGSGSAGAAGSGSAGAAGSGSAGAAGSGSAGAAGSASGSATRNRSDVAAPSTSGSGAENAGSGGRGGGKGGGSGIGPAGSGSPR